MRKLAIATAALALAIGTTAHAQTTITRDHMGREVMRTTRNQDGSTVTRDNMGRHLFTTTRRGDSTVTRDHMGREIFTTKP
jgi:pentapeptide MXKDX repeat protein